MVVQQPISTYCRCGAILFFLALLLIACNEYEESPTDNAALVTLNRIVDSAKTQEASWTSSPEKIAHSLFPRMSSEGNSSYTISYTISSKGSGDTLQRVIVTQEGVNDDEVLGERHIITFKQKENEWKIVDYHFAIKRRN